MRWGVHGLGGVEPGHEVALPAKGYAAVHIAVRTALTLKSKDATPALRQCVTASVEALIKTSNCNNDNYANNLRLFYSKILLFM